ncbi:MAG TPA: hypothetical protein VEZ59_04250 [Sphingopyxis sp.]|nr:hypothetical protein [Sphingopyxis sp.]
MGLPRKLKGFRLFNSGQPVTGKVTIDHVATGAAPLEELTINQRVTDTQSGGLADQVNG